MERRQQERFPTDIAARITILGQERRTLAGVVESVSAGGMRVAVPEPLENTPVEIDWGKGLALGDICWCRPEGARFVAGVKLQHSLGCLADLENLTRRLLGGSPRQEIGRPAKPL